MASYIIEITYPDDEFLDTLEKITDYNPDLLSLAAWGNLAGDEKVWLFMDVEDESDIAKMLPPNLRDCERHALVEQYTIEDVQAMRQRRAA